MPPALRLPTTALVGSRFMGFNRNKTIFSGVREWQLLGSYASLYLTGLLSGYFFTRAFEASNISRINSTTHSVLLGGGRNDDQLK
ncbi:hypothetical protein JVU11DRAFT_9398 [Chiua virens]|nr:hypothetical protein JVU11DRAFT_9398 [Chiua virens]